MYICIHMCVCRSCRVVETTGYYPPTNPMEEEIHGMLRSGRSVKSWQGPTHITFNSAKLLPLSVKRYLYILSLDYSFMYYSSICSFLSLNYLSSIFLSFTSFSLLSFPRFFLHVNSFPYDLVLPYPHLDYPSPIVSFFPPLYFPSLPLSLSLLSLFILYLSIFLLFSITPPILLLSQQHYHTNYDVFVTSYIACMQCLKRQL